QNDFVFALRVAAPQHADNVAGIPLLPALARDFEFAGHVLDVAAIVPQGLNPNLPQLRRQVCGGKQFVMRAAGPALQRVAGQELHGATDLAGFAAGWLLSGQAMSKEERNEQSEE